MLRRVGWLPLLMAFVLAASCGGSDSGSQQPVTTASATSTTPDGTPTTPTTAVTSTTGSTPNTPYGEFLADPDAFFAKHASDDPTTDPMGGSPDYEVAEAFLDEVGDLDLTGVDVWVWPVATTGETLLILDIPETATAMEDSDVSDALGMAMVTSSALNDAGITTVVISYQGSDADGPYYVDFMVPFDALKATVLDGTELDQDQVLLEISRDG